MSHPLIPSTLAADLAQVDALISARLAPRAAVFQAAGSGVLAPDAPRLRAALVLLCAQLGEYDVARVTHSAAAVELIHAAAQVHDALIDDAERRRGSAGAPQRWGGDVALMVGDYLFALAAAEMALAPDPRIIAYFSRAVMLNCEGQLAPVRTLTPRAEAVAQYRYHAECTTAALFEAACKAGVVCGGGDEERIAHAGSFGRNLGLAWQIEEDVRDYAADEAPLGYAPGRALRAGVITLPLIYAVEEGGDPALAAIIDQHEPGEERIRWALDAVRRAGANARARDEAQRAVARALDDLNTFPASPARAALAQSARAVGTG